MDPWLELIATLMACANTAWMFSACIIAIGKDAGIRGSGAGVFRMARWIFHEVKPFFRPFAVILCLDHTFLLNSWSWVPLLTLAGQFVLFHFYKDIDDDDRWEKRKRRVLDKITITDGKLAVIPA